MGKWRLEVGPSASPSLIHAPILWWPEAPSDTQGSSRRFTNHWSQDHEKTSHRLEENICKKHLICKIYKAFLKPNNEKINNPIRKWAADLDRHLTKEDTQMSGKRMERHSTSQVIRELHIKMTSTTTHHLETLKSQTLTRSNADKDVEPQELSYIAGGNAKWYSYFGRQFTSFLKLNILFTYDPEIVLLGIYSKELRTYV